MQLGAWLMGLAGPVAKKVLSALGFGVITYVGFEAGLNQLLGLAKSQWASGDAAVLGLLNLAGAGTAMAIISGALVSRLAMVALKKLDLL